MLEISKRRRNVIDLTDLLMKINFIDGRRSVASVTNLCLKTFKIHIRFDVT